MPRTFVMGDPQGPFEKILEVLDRHGALAGDRLAPDVRLLSIGDHFDYDLKDPVTAGKEGVRSLRWLASHDPAQVTLLLGNHDASRVMELARLDDRRFAEAYALARAINATEKEDGLAAATERELREFLVEFPDLPASGVIGRDYAAYTTEQRGLVAELLLAGRFHLARTGVLPDGRVVLLTHAGVTERELGMLGLDVPRTPHAIAAALEAFLAQAIANVRDAWGEGDFAPLSLAPLQIAGARGEEGGGLLYHRPTNPTNTRDPVWARNPARPRRFDPRALPGGITQIVGHTGHAKCMSELGAWVAPAARARAHGGLRSLRVHEGEVVYDAGVMPHVPGAAEMIFTDGELRRVPAREVELLPLAQLDA